MSSESRKAKRHYIQHGAKLARADGVALGQCLVVDVSATGARLRIDGGQNPPIPDHFLLVLSHTGTAYRQCAVVWREGVEIGVEFIPQRRENQALRKPSS